MAKTQVARTQDIQQTAGGALAPFAIASGLLDLVTEVTEQGAMFFHVPMEIVEIRSRVRVAAGTAAGTARFGIVGTVDHFGTQAHDTTDAAGTEFTWTLTNTLIPAGSVCLFTADGGATGTGSCDVTVVVRPVQNPS